MNQTPGLASRIAKLNAVAAQGVSVIDLRGSDFVVLQQGESKIVLRRGDITHTITGLEMAELPKDTLQ